MSFHHKAHETSHDTRRSKVQKKQKETQKVAKPCTSLSEDAVVVQYWLWLTGLWANSGKWDQLKAAECTETPSELQEAGEYFRDYHCSFALFCCILNCELLPQNENLKVCPYFTELSAAFSMTIGKTNKSHFTFRKQLGILHIHTLYVSILFMPEINPIIWVWWRWADTFGVCFPLRL